MQNLTGTKAKIFDVAVDLFSQHGYNGVSVRKIAAGAGIKESSLYNHFKNKEDILNCILDFFHEGMEAQRPDVQELSHEIEFMAPREIFRLIFIKYGKNRNAGTDKMAVIILMEQYINPRARSFAKRFMLEEPINYYQSILQAMADRKRVRDDIDLRIVAEELHYGFLGIIFNLAIAVQEGGDDWDLLRKLCSHVDFVFERLER